MYLLKGRDRRAKFGFFFAALTRTLFCRDLLFVIIVCGDGSGDAPMEVDGRGGALRSLAGLLYLPNKGSMASELFC